jgi:ferredoxin
MRVHADLDACQGALSCVDEAPEAFDVNDDGTVEVLQPQPPEHLVDDVRAAVRACPTRALSLTQD